VKLNIFVMKYSIFLVWRETEYSSG